MTGQRRQEDDWLARRSDNLWPVEYERAQWVLWLFLILRDEDFGEVEQI